MLSSSIHSLSRDQVVTTRQIPLPRRRWFTRIGLPAVIVLTTAALLAFASRDLLAPATAVRIVRAIAKPGAVVRTPMTNESNLPRESSASNTIIAQAPGWVEPDPFPIRIPALTEGTLEQVIVLEGDLVVAEQVVARMVDAEAKLDVQRAQAEVDRRQAMVDEAQAQWDHPVARIRAVAVGKAMIVEAHAEMGEVQSMTLVEKAKLAELEGHLDRLARLPEGVVEQDRLERTRFQVEAHRASVQVLAARQSVVKAKLKRYEAEHTAVARDMELRIEEKHSLAQAKAMLAEAHTSLAQAMLRAHRMEIRSPAAGVVMQRFASPGVRMMLTSDQPEAGYVAALYDPKMLQVRTDVPLGDAAKIGVGQRAQIVVDVLPDRVFTGRVTRLVHQADISKNTIQVKVAIDDPVAQLKPEMLARVKFLAQTASEDRAAAPTARADSSVLRIFVPEEVVVKHLNGTAVWIVDAKSNTARRKVITLGSIRHDNWIETTAGLNPGDAVITTPQGLEEGQRVRILGEVEEYSKQ